MLTIHCRGPALDTVHSAISFAGYGAHPIVDGEVWTFHLPETNTKMTSMILAHVMTRHVCKCVLWSHEPNVLSFS